MDFKYQYKHPLWQKKRLEALENAEFICQRCGDCESQLHVHHKNYFKGRKIWEYGTEELSVLCESCHEQAHVEKDALNSVISLIDPDGYSEIVGIVASYCLNVNGPAHVNCEREVDEINEPHYYAVGRLAAAFANLSLGVQKMLEIANHVESRARDEDVFISIDSKKKRFFR